MYAHGVFIGDPPTGNIMNKIVVTFVLLSILASGLVGYWLGENMNPDLIKPHQEVWLDRDIMIAIVSNQTTSLGWTEIDLKSYVPSGTKIVKLLLGMKADTIGTGNYSVLDVRKHGTLPSHFPQIKVDSNDLVGVKYREFVEVGISNDLKIDYAVTVGLDWQIDARIILLGYTTEG